MATLPSSPLRQAVLLHRKGRLDRAGRLYQCALRDDPGAHEAMHGLGMIAFQRGDQTKAVEWLQAAIALHADAPSYYYDLGNVWRKLGAQDGCRRGLPSSDRTGSPIF